MTDEHNEHVEPEQWGDADHSLVSDDPWHSHVGEAPPQEAHGETTPGAIAIGGLISFGIVVFFVGFVWLYFDQVLQSKYEQVVETDRGAEFRQNKEDWDAELTGFEWRDAESGAIRVPLDLAIDQVAEEYAR